MKKVEILLLSILTVGFISCADFLEVEPKDRVTGNALLSSDGGIRAYMAGHYYNLPIEDFRYDFCTNFNVGRCDGGKTNMMIGAEATHSEWGDHIGDTKRYDNWEKIYKKI